MDRILHNQHDCIKLYPSDINNHFTSLASRLTCRINEQYDFTEFFKNISNDVNADTFKIKHSSYNDILKILLGIKSDCSMVHDGILIWYLKPVVDDVISPFVYIINTCINNRVFSSTRKIAHVYLVPKKDHTKDVTELRPISILCILSKFLNELYCINYVIF